MLREDDVQGRRDFAKLGFVLPPLSQTPNPRGSGSKLGRNLPCLRELSESVSRKPGAAGRAICRDSPCVRCLEMQISTMEVARTPRNRSLMDLAETSRSSI